MLEFSAVPKKVSFKFTDTDNTTHNLCVTEMLVKDVDRLISMQKELVNKDDTIDLYAFRVSRILCAVKIDGTDVPYWNCTVEEFREKNYPSELVPKLHDVVDEVNPMNTESLDEKKSDS